MRMSTNDYEFDIRETSFTCQSSFNTFLTLFGEKLNLLLIKKNSKTSKQSFNDQVHALQKNRQRSGMGTSFQ